MRELKRANDRKLKMIKRDRVWEKTEKEKEVN